MKISKANLVLVILSSCLFLFAGYWVFAWYDTQVSLFYARRENDRLKSREQLQRSLLLKLGKATTRKDLTQLLSKNYSQERLVKVDDRENSISIDDVIFKFQGSDLVEVLSY